VKLWLTKVKTAGEKQSWRDWEVTSKLN